MTPTEYLADIQAELVTSDLVVLFEVEEEWAQSDRGYIRIRIWLANGDFLEVSEYFVVSNEVCVTERYRYQWMDTTQKQMRRRWDNVEYYLGLHNFPHHVHFADGRVEPGENLSVLDLLERLASEIS